MIRMIKIYICYILLVEVLRNFLWFGGELYWVMRFFFFLKVQVLYFVHV